MPGGTRRVQLGSRLALVSSTYNVMPLLSTRIFPNFESASATVAFAVVSTVLPATVVGVGAVAGRGVVDGDASNELFERPDTW